MLRRRRHPPEYSSPNICNPRRLDHRLRSRSTTPNTRWSATAEEEEAPSTHDFDDSSRPRRRSVAVGSSSKLRVMMRTFGSGGRLALWSSLGSCAAWNARSSHMERSPPPTPSTICSSPRCSLSSSDVYCSSDQVSTTHGLSFFTAKQSSCIITNDGKKLSAPPPEEAERDRIRISRHPATRPLFKKPVPVLKMRELRVTEREGMGRQRRVSKAEMREARYVRAGRRRLSCERGFSFKATSLKEVDGGIPAPEAEAEEEDRATQGSIINQAAVSSLPSSDNNYCSGSSNASQYYESSDAVSMVEGRRSSVVQVRMPPLRSAATDTRRKEAMDRLMAWKEARIMMLMNKLKAKEASIDSNEKKRTSKAKTEMKKLEATLENVREKGMKKMQGKIKVAQMEAEKKKAKQREAASKRISMVTEAVESMVITGKTPWRLLFL